VNRQTTRAKGQLTRRLFPLYTAAFFQGTSFFFPIEKLFMIEIGFTPATIGLMVAFYAAFVPLIEAPSGILADRWSRKYVLVIASVALMAMGLIGGVSQGVPSYLLATVFLSVFLAMFSGTYDAVLYDVMLEETGTSDAFETHIGRLRFVFGLAVMLTSLLGGVLASLFGLRFTYFAGLPLIAISVAALLRFREPQLHKSQEALSLRSQVAQTYRVIFQRSTVLPTVAILVAAALLTNVVVEFSSLWLIALAVGVALYGPLGAGILAADGFGGLLAGRARLDRRIVVTIVSVLLVASSLALILVQHTAVVMAAHITTAGIAAVIAIAGTRRLHDQVPSNVRTGVASGVGALTWMVFVPFSIVFGTWAEHSGVFAASWMILPLAILASALLVKISADAHSSASAMKAIDSTGAQMSSPSATAPAASQSIRDS